MTQAQAPEWLDEAVADGLSALLLLRLDRAPAADTINAVADVWLHALMHSGTTWSAVLDAARVRLGFSLLIGRAQQWPAPRDLLQLLPAREPAAALPPPRSNGMSADLRAQLDALTKKQTRHADAVYIGRHDLLAAMRNHHGAGNGISAEQLARELHCTARHVRVLVTELRMDGEHICGTPAEGYFMAESPEDLISTCDFLKGRALKSLLLASRMTKVSIPDLFGQMKLPT